MKYKLIHEMIGEIHGQWEICEDGDLIQYKCPICKKLMFTLKNSAAPCQCEWCGAKLDK